MAKPQINTAGLPMNQPTVFIYPAVYCAVGSLLLFNRTPPNLAVGRHSVIIDDEPVVFRFRIFLSVVEWWNRHLRIGSQDYRKMAYSVCLCGIYSPLFLPSVLWRCWLGSRKAIPPVKKWVMMCWMVICLGWGAGLHMVHLMPLLFIIYHCSKSRLVLPFSYWLTRAVPDKGPLNGCCSALFFHWPSQHLVW